MTIDQLLKQERIAPKDIDFVAITQPITYHSGGLTAPYFPNANVHISRAGVLEMLLENEVAEIYGKRQSGSFAYALPTPMLQARRQQEQEVNR